MEIQMGPFEIMFATVAAMITMWWFCFAIGKWIAEKKIKSYEEREGLMTKIEFDKKCRENQADCPQMNVINIKLKKILDLSEANSTHTRHIAECFLLYLSQTQVDKGVQEFIEDKLKQQAGITNK